VGHPSKIFKLFHAAQRSELYLVFSLDFPRVQRRLP
jgi:hypothetical protein